jgi:hypothetical protein
LTHLRHLFIMNLVLVRYQMSQLERQHTAATIVASGFVPTILIKFRQLLINSKRSYHP